MKRFNKPLIIRAKLKKDSTSSLEEIEIQKEIPQGDYIMLEKLIGDGNATVRVGGEVSSKTYGNGISVTVSLTLTVNQDLGTIESASQIASQIVQDELDKSIPAVKRIYEEHFEK